MGARVLRIMEDVGFGSLLHTERSHKGWKYMLESSVHWRVASGWGKGGKEAGWVQRESQRGNMGSR